MWKADYHTDAYARAEWRHCLSILSCSNVKVYGLTLADSGGDGIYLGVAQRGVTNTNVHIKDVVCDGNNRQGISVISAENLLIEDTVLKNTSGTAPQAGIDFEPNHAGEKIVNCVMRNCVAENNDGGAYVLYLRPLDGTSAPISVRIEDCVSRGTNAISASITTSNGGPNGPAQGLIEFVNCRFEDTGTAGISVRDVAGRRLPRALRELHRGGHRRRAEAGHADHVRRSRGQHAGCGRRRVRGLHAGGAGGSAADGF